MANVTDTAFFLMFGFNPIKDELNSAEKARKQRRKQKNERQKKGNLVQV
tara:strand:- start:177 stop:323 length:147 start_codon:yes stop_codon:yes gene_type:complete